MLSIDAWLDEKPYREVYDGVIHEKVSPELPHAQVALRVARLLEDWGARRGAVGVEVRVHLAPGTTLVPDVAFFARERLAALSEAQRAKPPFAPDIAVEIRSPEDRDANVRRKTQLYLEYGAALVLNVDLESRRVYAVTADGEPVLLPGGAITHPNFPELHVPVAAIFAPLDETAGY